nr:hypothetical protein [Ruminococcus sp. AM28-29LB]
MTLKKNDIVNLTITSATAEGSGVGRTDDALPFLYRVLQSVTNSRCVY